MKTSFKVGLSFGMTSAILTTVGLMVGLYSSTRSELAVLGGILTVAAADSLSDALAIHISEESEKRHSERHVWEAMLTTLLTKALFALSFAVPVLFLTLDEAIVAGVAWGLLLITAFSYYLARYEKARPWKVIGEHLLIAVFIIIATYFIGEWIAMNLGGVSLLL
ncbi:hypothetical protein GF318_05235 [Candidatus Micrarchaeota archaeon]|nr:hypothetical protein [Candidatus Micrarchaeota archaeon]